MIFHVVANISILTILCCLFTPPLPVLHMTIMQKRGGSEEAYFSGRKRSEEHVKCHCYECLHRMENIKCYVISRIRRKYLINGFQFVMWHLIHVIGVQSLSPTNRHSVVKVS